MSIFSKKRSNIPRRRQSEKNDDNDKSATSSNVFRRNRTLTGTTSNNLDSTNTNTDLKSPRVHSHNLTIQRRRIASIFFVVLLSIILIWTLVSQLIASVSVVVPDTTISKSVDASKYEKIIQEYLDINPMSRLSFLLDQSALTEYVSNKMPEVSQVALRDTISIGKVNFAVTMRNPVAGWQINKRQYYVDSQGIPFEINYYPSAVVQIVDNSGISMQTGTTAIASKRFLSFVGRVVYLSKQNGYTVTQAALPANTTRELEIRLKECSYFVRLSIDRPAGEQVENMVQAIRYFTNHGQVPAYIDVRVSGKAFYK